MDLAAIRRGMDVVSRDGRVLGTVESVDIEDFTIVERQSLADGRVRGELVGSVDERVHLNVGPCGLDGRRHY